MSITDPAIVEYLLALADDEHFMGQRHTEWIGVTPFLEEDMAFASIGQDELGHAALLYELIDDDIDALALQRDPSDYRSSWLAEAECADWADALVRHWLYDKAEALRWAALEDSSVEALRHASARAQREERFHLLHADALLDALLQSTDAKVRILAALDRLLPLALGMFEAPAGEAAALDAGVATASLASMVEPWRDAVDDRFGAGDWAAIDAVEQRGRTLRSEAFGPTYDRMREVILLDPTATW